MASHRWIIIGLTVALVGTNLAWAYNAVNRGVTVQHGSEQLEHQQTVNELLGTLVVDLPRDRGAAPTLDYLRSRYPNRVVKREGDRIEIDNVVLEFEGDSLARVRPL
jgi:hypothetical protein